MIGNDVVDLKLASIESNWQRRGFLSKIFSTEEQKQIAAAKDPTLLVWLFWSMKESAYKANQRRFELKPLFNPWDFDCSITQFPTEKITGKIKVDKEEYVSSSLIENDCIYSFAQSLTDSSAFHHQICEANYRSDLLSTLAYRLNVSAAELQLQKDNFGIPHIFHLNRKMDFPFSISHHGNRGAFVIPKNFSVIS